MTFERSRDYALVREILTHPKVWPHVGDDFAGPCHAFEVNRDPRIVYLLARERGETLGVFTFLPESEVLWWTHAAMLPRAWGRSAKRTLGGAIAWMFAHTSCQRLAAQVPVTNPPAIAYAERAGFTRFGLNEKSFMKFGRLRDCVLLGISKGS